MKQVKSLKSLTRVHIPSLAVGMLFGALVASIFRRKAKAPVAAPVEAAEVAEATEASETAAKSREDA